VSGRSGGVAAIIVLGVCLLAGLILPGCDQAPPAPHMLIVGFGAGDWQYIRPLLAQGRLPNIQRLVSDGAHGPLWSIAPPNGPNTWTSIATGKGPDQHRLVDFTLPDPLTGKPILASGAARQSKAFWNILSEQGLRTCVVGWETSWPAEPIDGVIVSDLFFHHALHPGDKEPLGLVSPPELTDELLAIARDSLEVPYETARRFMELGPEEYASAAGDFADFVSHFRLIYQAMRAKTALAKHLTGAQSPDVIAVCYSGLAAASHLYARFTPPEHPNTTPEEREAFAGTLLAFYVHLDELLGELLDLTDKNTNVVVVSNHGFRAATQRPVTKTPDVTHATALKWPRFDGLLLMSGPKVRSKQSETDAPAVYTQATVFDVAPTLLALLDLPVGQDMEGTVLTDMLEANAALPDSIPTYEDEAWRENRRAAGSHPGDLDEQIVEKLLTLGYLGRDEDEQALTLRGQRSLADYFSFRRRYDEAERELQAIIEKAPDAAEPHFDLGLVNLRRKSYDAARANLERALELDPDLMAARMNLAFVLRELKDRTGALNVLKEAQERDPEHLGARVNMGMLYKEMDRFDQAIGCFEDALAIDSTYHAAIVQMAMIHEMQADLETAISYWERAVRSRPEDKGCQTHLESCRQALGE